MSIWSKPYTVKDIARHFNTKAHMAAHVGIEFTEIGNDFLKATMPVDQRTIQPAGILHGGASCVLSESMGSIAAHLVIDTDKQSAVGLEINANHIKSAVNGSKVTGVCKPLHIGKRTHVWQTDIYNDKNEMIATSRLTVAILDKKNPVAKP